MEAEDRYTSTVYQQDGGVWYGAIRWKDEDGKHRRKTKRFASATSKRMANAMLKQWEADMTLDEPRSDITLGEYLERYVERKNASRSIEQSTYVGYRYLFTYFKRVWDRRLDGFTREDAQEFMNSLVADGYSPSTIHHVYTLGNCVYRQAVEERMAPINPFVGVSKPKKRRMNPNFLDRKGREDLKEMLGYGKLTQLKVAAYIALYCGLRQGEVCGLRWRDIDLDRSMMTISRSIGRKENGYEVKSTKTDRIRTAPIPGALMGILKQWKLQSMEDHMNAGIHMTPDSYVVGEMDGSFLAPTTLQHRWKALTEAMDLKGSEGRPVTFHDLRHTFATAAITGGVDVKTVSSILGHANAAMTLNVYTAADPNAKQAAAKVMDSVI